MSIADRLVLHRAQPETLRGVVGRLLEPAVVEGQELGLAIFEKQFAIVSAIEAAGQNLGQSRPVEAGAIDERTGCRGHGVSFVACDTTIKIVFDTPTCQGLLLSDGWG
jgi:hypothetical protein